MPFCKECGAEIHPDDVFCPECGVSLEAKGATVKTAPKEPAVPRPKKKDVPVPKPKKPDTLVPKKEEPAPPKPKKDEIKRITVTGIIAWLWKAFIWIAGWFLGIVFFIYGLSTLQYGPLSLVLFPLSLLLIPTVRKLIKKKLKIELSTGLVIAIFLILCVILSIIEESKPGPVCDCTEYEQCIDGMCYPMKGYCDYCAPGDKCIEGKCYSPDDPCASCPPDEKCIDGVCYNEKELCAKCAPDEKCVDGRCISGSICGDGICEGDENCYNCQDCFCDYDKQCDSGQCVPIERVEIRAVTLFYDDFSEGFPATRWTNFEEGPYTYVAEYDSTYECMRIKTYEWVIDTPEPGVDPPSQQQPWIRAETLVRTAVNPFNSENALAVTVWVSIPRVSEAGSLTLRVRDQADDSKSAEVRIVPSSGKVYYTINGKETVSSDNPVPRDGEYHDFTFWVNTDGWAWWTLDEVEQVSTEQFYHGKYTLEIGGVPKRDWVQAAGVGEQYYYIDNVQVVTFETVE